MTDILAWLGENFGSGVVGAAGGTAFSDVLNLVFPQQDPVLSKLEQISGQLDRINQAIDTLQQSISSLHRELSVTRLEIEAQITEAQYGPAAIQLNADFGYPVDGDSQFPTSLLGLALSARQGPRQEAATALKKNIDDRTLDNITMLKNGLTMRSFGTSKSLLEKWTDLLIAKTRLNATERSKFYKYYVLLETYFMDVVAAQLKGYALMAASYGRTAPAGQSGELLALPHFVPIIHAEVSHFLDCVERLVLSQTDLWYDPQEFLDFWVPLGSALVRADVLCAALAGFAECMGPGTTWLKNVYGRYCCAQSTSFTYENNTRVLHIGDDQPIQHVYIARSGHDSGARVVDWLLSDDAFGTLAPIDSCGAYIVRVQSDNISRMDALWTRRFAGAGENHFIPAWKQGEFDLKTLGWTDHPVNTSLPIWCFFNVNFATRGPVFRGGRRSDGYQKSESRDRAGLLRITNETEFMLDQSSILSPCMGGVYTTRTPVDPTQPIYSKKFYLRRINRDPQGLEQIVQSVRAPLFKATAGGETVTVRLRGYVDIRMLMETPGRWNWVVGGVNVKYRVEIFLLGPDNSSQSIFNIESPWTTDPPADTYRNFTLASTVTTVAGAAYSLLMVHTSESQFTRTQLMSDLENCLSVDFTITAAAVTRPPEEGISV